MASNILAKRRTKGPAKFFTVTHAATLLNVGVAAARFAVESLGVEVAFELNGVQHIDAAGLEELRQHFRPQKPETT